MNNNRLLPAIMGALSLTALAVVIYMAFVVPGSIAQLMAEHGEVPAEYSTRAALSRFCSSYGLLLIPILLGALGASVWWWIRCGRKGP